MESTYVGLAAAIEKIQCITYTMPNNKDEFSQLILGGAIFGSVVRFILTGVGFIESEKLEKMSIGALIGSFISPSSSEEVCFYKKSSKRKKSCLHSLKTVKKTG